MTRDGGAHGPTDAASCPATAGAKLAGATVETGDGARLYVRDWGAGRPAVFLASWSLPSESWSYQMLPLVAAGYRAVAYDRRGHGRSRDPGGGYDFDTLADDLAARARVPGPRRRYAGGLLDGGRRGSAT